MAARLNICFPCPVFSRFRRLASWLACSCLPAGSRAPSAISRGLASSSSWALGPVAALLRLGLLPLASRLQARSSPKKLPPFPKARYSPNSSLLGAARARKFAPAFTSATRSTLRSNRFHPAAAFQPSQNYFAPNLRFRGSGASANLPRFALSCIRRCAAERAAFQVLKVAGRQGNCWFGGRNQCRSAPSREGRCRCLRRYICSGSDPCTFLDQSFPSRTCFPGSAGSARTRKPFALPSSMKCSLSGAR
jgi:hypothetical protein